MNLQLINAKKSTLVLLSLFLGNSVVLAENLQVSWIDSSNNEDGFTIEKRLLENDAFEVVSYLPADSTNYVDADVLSNETYCYRIAAYNQAGKSASDESCIEVTEANESELIIPKATIPQATTPETTSPDEVNSAKDAIVYSYSEVAITHEFISKPAVIEIGEKELYSFKSNENYNSDYSSDGLVNANFSINKGKVYYSSNSYSFQQGGVELSNGYASMSFNTGNTLSFDLVGSGAKQTATLYLQAGAWSNQSSSVIVTVGNKSENIELPRGYAWLYVAVDIEFDGSAPVTITTDSDRDGYSAVMFAGIVLNEADVVEEAEVESIQYASLLDIDTSAEKIINITDAKYMTSAWLAGNDELSNATVQELSYYGKTKNSSSTYQFVNDDGQTYSGHENMSWSEDNGVSLKLKSGDSEVNTVAIYFSAGAWTKNVASIEVLINGESEIIDLSSGYSWKYYKVEIEFEGELDVDIHPVGAQSGYSGFKFAGLTLN